MGSSQAQTLGQLPGGGPAAHWLMRSQTAFKLLLKMCSHSPPLWPSRYTVFLKGPSLRRVSCSAQGKADGGSNVVRCKSTAACLPACLSACRPPAAYRTHPLLHASPPSLTGCRFLGPPNHAP